MPMLTPTQAASRFRVETFNPLGLGEAVCAQHIPQVTSLDTAKCVPNAFERPLGTAEKGQLIIPQGCGEEKRGATGCSTKFWAGPSSPVAGPGRKVLNKGS